MGGLGRKMIRYMNLRHLSPKTKRVCIHQINGLVNFYNRRPDIIGTLYSIGLFKQDRTEKAPHELVVPNEFCKKVNSSLLTVKERTPEE